MKKFFLWLRRLIASIKTALNKDKYKKHHEASRLISILMTNMAASGHIMTKLKPFKHPFHDKSVLDYKENIKKFKKSEHKDKPVTVAFGDSILDIPKADYQSIPYDFNFAISGSWHFHMKEMIKDLRTSLKDVNVKNVVIGTLGGNPFLTRQEYDTIINYSLEALNYARKTFPEAKIIVYGLPPVHDVYATAHAIDYEEVLYKWVARDINAVFIPMNRKFSKGPFGLTPSLDMSSDGVHLSDKGVVEFDVLIEKAKTTPAGTIVD